MTPEKRTIRSLLGIIFIHQIYITITFPLVTLIFFDPRSHLFAADVPSSTRSLWYGLCVALPSLINLFFAPTLSALSDEIGRKSTLIIEIFSAVFFTLLVGIGIYKGILICIFLGFTIRGALSRTNPTALVIMGDTAPRAQKMLYMGYLQCAICMGAFIGPILGGYFASRFLFNLLNFSLPFFIAATMALLNTFLAFFFIRETLKKPVDKTVREFSLASFKQVALHRDVLRVSVLLLLIQLAWSMYYQFIPPILTTLKHFNPRELGFFIGGISLWLAIGAGFWMKIFNRFLSMQQILRLSIYLLLAGLILTFLACANWLPHYFVWLGAIPTATGDVIAYSCLTALYSNLVAHEKQGKVMGLGFIVTSSAWAMTGFLGGILMSLSPLAPLLVAPLSIIAAIYLSYANFGQKLALCIASQTAA